MQKPIEQYNVLRKEIPAFLAKPIGQLITKWSYLEYRLSLVIWALMGVDDRVGRLAVADPRAQQKLEIIKDLFFLRGRILNEPNYKRAYDAIEEIQGYRDMLAHGLWVSENGDWKIIKFSGHLNDQTLPRTERKRKVRPESFLAKPEGLSKIVAQIDALIKSIESFDKIIALIHKSQKRSATAGRKAPIRKPPKRQRQRQSSQGK